MKRTYLSLAAIVTLCFSLLLISGCGSSGNKEGDGPVAAVGDTLCNQCHSATMDPITGESIVAQYDRSSPHKDSAHANNGNGCEACHGNAAQHQGVGPIQYPNPYANNGERCTACHTGNYAGNFNTKFADSLHANMTIETSASCRRCHTHEGAVLADANGWTGTKEVIDNVTYQAPAQKEFAAFQCSTCHEHGGGLRAITARDSYSVGGAAAVGTGNIVSWNPSKSNQLNDQFNLCTSCHNLKTYDGKYVAASGTATLHDGQATVKVGHHETSWYRVIATTHNNNADNATNGISGYVIRIPKTAEDAYALTTKPNAKPCFDCHAHEAKTNTPYSNPSATNYDATKATIYTDWAKSPHAGELLTAKVTAAGAGAATAAQVDTVMDASVDGTTAAAWLHYDWSGKDRQDCQQCHTATGASNYLKNPATYDKTKNDFQHLAGWTNVASHTGTPATFASKQREVLYCWGCHSSAGVGTRRAPGAITANYNFQGAAAKFPDVSDSNICISCHRGMGASGESISSTTALTDATITSGTKGPITGHYLAAAGTMYVKIGFTAFTDSSTPIGTSTYGKSLTSTDDGGAISSTHRKFGTAAIIGDHGITASDTALTSGGPCVTCHMANASHTWAINANAFNTVCIKCHTKEGATPLTGDNFLTVFVDPQKEVFQDALTLAKAILKTNFKITYDNSTYPYFFDDNLGGVASANQVKNWTRTGVAGVTALSAADARKLMGACFNIQVLDREPGAFAHARTYTRRLIYDTIDFLDNRKIDLSAVATAIAADPVTYGKGATAYTDKTLTTLAPGTTEAMTFLAGWNHGTGLWNTPERP